MQISQNRAASKKQLPISAWRRPVVAVIWWLYLLVSCYLIIGVILFPSWWNRALFQFELVDPKFLRFACLFLWNLLTSVHPLGLLLPSVALFATIWSIYHYGKFGSGHILEHITPPKRSLRVFFGVVLIVLITSLRFANVYKTPDELNTLIQAARNQAEAPFDEISPQVVYAPSSGYYMYLDVPRVRAIYGSLQNFLEIERQTTKTERERKLGVEATIPRVKVDASGRVLEEETTTKVPVTLTPERQAKHLIEFCQKDTRSLTATTALHIKKIEYAIKVLKEANITLQPEQHESAVNSITQILSKDVFTRGNVIVCSGATTISRLGTNFQVHFAPMRIARVAFTAELEAPFTDKMIGRILSQTNETEIRMSMLAVELERTGSGTNLNVNLLPIAIW